MFFLFAAMLMAVTAMTMTSCESKNGGSYDAEVARVKAAAQGSWEGELFSLVGENEIITVTFTETKVSTKDSEGDGVSANIQSWTYSDGKVVLQLDDDMSSKLYIVRVYNNEMELSGNSTFTMTNFPTILTKK